VDLFHKCEFQIIIMIMQNNSTAYQLFVSTLYSLCIMTWSIWFSVLPSGDLHVCLCMSLCEKVVLLTVIPFDTFWFWISVISFCVYCHCYHYASFLSLLLEGTVIRVHIHGSKWLKRKKRHTNPHTCEVGLIRLL